MNKNDIDHYIAGFPPDIQEGLKQIREIILKAAPKAEEVISYKMPAYKQHGIVVYFAGYKKHIGFYPTNSGIEAFQDELGDYTWSKGAIQFPLGKPMPKGLITKIVKFRLKEDAENEKAKKARKK